MGDAITGQAFLIRNWLRALGFKSDIFALYVHPSVVNEVKTLGSYKRVRGETWAIYHHSIGSDVPIVLSQQPLTLLLIYHNITPAKYFTEVDPKWADLAREGLAQLHDLRTHTGMALADSEFNELDLVEAGYPATTVLPITLREEHFKEQNSKSTEDEIRLSGPNLLFVGRFVPNKKQEDLVQLLTYVHRIHPSARMHLIGSRWEVGYDTYVEKTAAALGISDKVIITGKISHQDLLTYYRTADLYVSMSEHEGFGVPLIESMYCKLPILAYGSSAIPYTLGTAGVIFSEKRYAELAELIDILLTDEAFRQRIITRQLERVQAFLEPQVRIMFERILENLKLFN